MKVLAADPLLDALALSSRALYVFLAATHRSSELDNFFISLFLFLSAVLLMFHVQSYKHSQCARRYSGGFRFSFSFNCIAYIQTLRFVRRYTHSSMVFPVLRPFSILSHWSVMAPSTKEFTRWSRILSPRGHTYPLSQMYSLQHLIV